MATQAAQVESVLSGFLDQNGNPLASGKLYVFAAGTSTPFTTYQDKDKGVAHAHPITLDAQGQALVFIDGLVKFELRDSSDVAIPGGIFDGLQYFFVQETVDTASIIKAADGTGIRIEDDGGNLGVFVEDGGQVGIGHALPEAALHTVSSGVDSYATSISVSPLNSDISLFENNNVGGNFASLLMRASSVSPGIARLIAVRDAPSETSFAIQLADSTDLSNTVEQFLLTSEGDLTVGGSFSVDNINIDGNTISSTDTNGDINLSPNGTGTVVINTDLDVDNLNLDGNTISSVSNGIILTPFSGSQVLIDGHWGFSGAIMSGQTAVDTTINSFAGQDVVINGNTITTLGFNSDVILPDGSAATPSLRFENLLDAGLFRAGSDIGVATAGTERARVLSDGKFVIGASTATSNLEVVGNFRAFEDDAGTDRGILLDNSASNDTGIIDTPNATTGIQINVGGSEKVRIDTSGNIGVGTSTPGGIFEVEDGTAGTVIRSIINHTDNTNSSSSAILQLQTGGASGGDPKIFFKNAVTDWSLGVDNSDGDKFKIAKNDELSTSTHFTIDTSGNAGIGTDSPNFSTGSGLEISRNGPATLRLTDLGSGNKNVELSVDDAGAFTINSQDSGLSMVFKTFDTERMRITESGLVGIGTSNPLNTLDINAATASMELKSTSDSIASFTIDAGATSDAVILLDDNNVTNWAIGMDSSNSNAYTISNSGGLGTLNRIVVSTSGNLALGAPDNVTDPEGAALTSRYKVQYSGTINKFITGSEGIVLENIGSGTGGADIYLAKGRGGENGSTLDGDILGTIQFGSGTGSQYSTPVAIAAIANGTQSGSSRPSDLVLYTSITDSSYQVNNERMRILSDGKVGIGSSAPSAQLHVLADGVSSQIILERAGSSAGFSYIGADADGFSVFDSSIAKIFNISNDAFFGFDVAPKTNPGSSGVPKVVIKTTAAVTSGDTHLSFIGVNDHVFGTGIYESGGNGVLRIGIDDDSGPPSVGTIEIAHLNPIGGNDTHLSLSNNLSIGAGLIPTNTIDISRSAPVVQIKSSDDTASTIIIDSGATSDAFINFKDNSVDTWSVGNDATDNTFRISSSGALGTNDQVVVTSAGDVGIGGSPNASYSLDVTAGDSRVGWHGDEDTIKILPSDFMVNIDNTKHPGMFWDDSNGGVVVDDNANELYCFVSVPVGYKATDVRIDASGTIAIEAFSRDINSAAETSLGTGNTNANVDITDENSDATNYIMIRVNVVKNEYVYGGTVTIARI